MGIWCVAVSRYVVHIAEALRHLLLYEPKTIRTYWESALVALYRSILLNRMLFLFQDSSIGSQLSRDLKGLRFVTLAGQDFSTDGMSELSMPFLNGGAVNCQHNSERSSNEIPSP